MALPNWPAINSTPQADSWKRQPWGPGPIVTEMEGGNVRQRRRPGDQVALVTQTIRFEATDLATFETWFSDTLGGGTGRFRADVWNGSAFTSKVCQFNLSNPLQYAAVNDDTTDVAMQLRVYG